MNTAFSHALRVVSCPACGAVVHGSSAAATLTCEGCGEALALGARLEREEQDWSGDEPARLSALASQDGAPLRPPPEVKALVEDGALPDERVEEATALWQSTRAAIGERSEPDEGLERRFYFLSRLLYERLIDDEEEDRLRAILETAIETARSPRYRQTFRCMLACEAARGGDVVSAGEWLAPCDARSGDIHADSVYRYSTAYIATHKRQWAEVIDVLGAAQGDVPLALAFDATCSVLRANAHERRKDLSAAVYELSEAMKRLPGGVADVDAVIRDNGSLELCRRSYGKARKRIEIEGEAVPEAGPTTVTSSGAPVGSSKVLPWVVTSLACFGVAVGLSGEVRFSGVRIDLLLAVAGVIAALPVVKAVRR